MNNDIVMIKLDRERQLKFTHTGQKTLVAMTGKSIEEIDKNFDLNDFEQIEVFVYCGLLYDAEKHKETLTQEQIPALLDEAPSQAHIWEKLIAAWRVAFGVPAQPEGNQQPPAEQPENENRTTGKKASA